MGSCPGVCWLERLRAARRAVADCPGFSILPQPAGGDQLLAGLGWLGACTIPSSSPELRQTLKMMKHHLPSVDMSPFRMRSPKSSSMRAISTPSPVASGQLQRAASGGTQGRASRQGWWVGLQPQPLSTRTHRGAGRTALPPLSTCTEGLGKQVSQPLRATRSSTGRESCAVQDWCWNGRPGGGSRAACAEPHLMRTSRTPRSSSGSRLQGSPSPHGMSHKPSAPASRASSSKAYATCACANPLPSAPDHHYLFLQIHVCSLAGGSWPTAVAAASDTAAGCGRPHRLPGRAACSNPEIDVLLMLLNEQGAGTKRKGRVAGTGARQEGEAPEQAVCPPDGCPEEKEGGGRNRTSSTEGLSDAEE